MKSFRFVARPGNARLRANITRVILESEHDSEAGVFVNPNWGMFKVTQRKDGTLIMEST